MSSYLKIKSYPLKLIVIILLVLGIFLRFVNIDKKIYWHDEAFTSFRIAGYTVKEIKENIYINQEITVADIQKFQHINSQRTWIDALSSQAKEDGQHPPLYYLLLRFWEQVFGSSPAAIRTLTAILSLLLFPAVYWLSIELFNSSTIGWAAIALVAISPFHLLYAQNAKQYSLWSVIVVLSSAAILRAIKLERNHNKINWLIYGITLVIGLYTYPLTALVALSHGIYLIIIKGWRLTKSLIAYLVTFSIAFISFTPWLYVMSLNNFKGIDWLATKTTTISLFTTILGNISRVFIDFNLDSQTSPLLVFPLVLSILFLVAYSIYFICFHTPKHTWLFIIIIISVNILCFLLPDLLFGGRRSTVARYLIPSYLFMQLSVVYLFAKQIFSNNSFSRKFWQATLAIFTLATIMSCYQISNAESWWTQIPSNNHPQIIKIINQSKNSLLISDDSAPYNFGNLLSLSYRLHPDIKLLLVPEKEIPNISHDYDNVFLLHPAKDLRAKLEKTTNHKVKLINKPGMLWRLEKNK
ncbi:glycosyltransferase family 39 protein [Nostoc sp. XA010]|uniref:glycosyltransferase family 39 protein n=1 Tax=Nostoc sp. XA010 TaxID=2780407 RepID=UPI001E512CE0|nr:glycosyltransferase family 39 protein [Nostoc sp. XA010]MCC5661876.1 glycosyltransferase family 39 protein [Nostoc sp. XA010]